MSEGSKKLGKYLKSRREAKGRSVEDIAEALKITTINIMNIENGNIESIGLSEIFVRSYIKSYITELGESPDDIFNKFYEFQNKESTKVGGELNASTVFYNPIILVTGVLLFALISYFFINYAVKRDAGVLEFSNIKKVELNKETENDDKGTFSKDYDNTYSNYSETVR